MMDDNEDKVPRQCSIWMRTMRHVLLCVQTCTVKDRHSRGGSRREYHVGPDREKSTHTVNSFCQL